jgi:DNA-binding LytR/AlgR family response regulator
MHILIADDERPARSELKYILSQLAGTAVYTEATNGQEALDIVAEQPVDVIFLDINMPGVNGLAAAAAMLGQPEPPLIVFATAYDAHAVRAFELAALDYVVKPFNEQRLAQTMIRIRKALESQKGRLEKQEAMREYLATHVPSGAEAAVPAQFQRRLWGRRENKNSVPVDFDDILWIEAAAKKVHIQTIQGEKLLARHTLKELEISLKPHNFIRVHKGYLVNLSHIVEIVPWFTGTYQVRMKNADRTQIPMSRQYAQQLKKETGLF